MTSKRWLVECRRWKNLLWGLLQRHTLPLEISVLPISLKQRPYSSYMCPRRSATILRDPGHPTDRCTKLVCRFLPNFFEIHLLERTFGNPRPEAQPPPFAIQRAFSVHLPGTTAGLKPHKIPGSSEGTPRPLMFCPSHHNVIFRGLISSLFHPHLHHIYFY